MAEIFKLPSSAGAPDGGGGKFVHVGFALFGIVLSVGSAVLTGGWMMGKMAQQVTNLTEMLTRDHNEQKADIARLTANVATVSSQEAVHATQIDSLRFMIQQERSDRLEAEKQFYGRMK